jgi:hypothetical protein
MDRDNWAKTAVAKLEFQPSFGDPEAALRIAWKQVRYNYPEIAAFPYQGIYMYRIGNPDQVSLWVSATFSVVHNTPVEDLLGRIPRNEQMMLYWLPDSCEVLIRSPHYRLDARGAIFCLDQLIQCLANLNPVLVFGGCADNLSPSIDEALSIPYEYSSKIEKQALKRMDALEPHNPPLELTPTIIKTAPGATKRRYIKLSRAETRAILSGCAKSKMEITPALHAALINSCAKIVKPTDKRSFMASYHCDLREHIKKPVSTKKAPTVCTSIITTDVKVSPKTSFKTYYKDLAPVYKDGYKPYIESTACFHEKLTAKNYSSGRESESADSRPQPRFGPLGVIDDQLTKEVHRGEVRVLEFWLGTEVLTKRPMVHSWIFEEQMVFSCCFNESFWQPSYITGLLQGIKDTLIEEVALSSMLADTSLSR